MNFEFDPAKSASNRDKHGIDFEEAQQLWADPDLLEVPAISVDEPRFLTIGRIGDRVWAAIVTWREYRTRIISVRRARPAEIEHYENF